MNEILRVENLTKRYAVRGGFFSRPVGWVRAALNVSFQIAAGETLGLVGESGCGKTTVGRMVSRLIQPDDGKIFFEKLDITNLRGRHLKPFRRKMQVVFQDPYSSLNPRMKVGDIIAEPLLIHHVVSARERKSRVEELLSQVGLPVEALDRYPHEFSGGQRQRIGIARALALTPQLIVADEPVSALDVSVAAQIINLLKDLQVRFGMSYLFISHDLKVVHYLSHRIAVMYLGEIVEIGSKADLLRPLHPYTQALMAAVPRPDPTWKEKERKVLLKGEIPSPVAPPPGCSFHTRCPYAEKRCREEKPALQEWRKDHWVSCHFVDQINKT